jgi:hypothetical protein
MHPDRPGRKPRWLDTCEIAAKYGHFNILWWARRLGAQWSEKMWARVAESNVIDSPERIMIFDQLLEAECPREYGTTGLAMYEAASAGDISAVEWLHRHNFALGHGTLSAAAENGHLNVIKWLYGNIYPGLFFDHALAGAIKGYRLEIFNWLADLNIRTEWTEQARAAVIQGSLSILEQIIARDRSVPLAELYILAAQHCQLATFIWLNKFMTSSRIILPDRSVVEDEIGSQVSDQNKENEFDSWFKENIG